jgi:hypothetical protein
MAAIATGHAWSLLTNATITAGIPLIGSHCYVLVSITETGPGSTDYVLVVRNVWGFDGAGPYDSDPSDGLVTILGAQAVASFSCAVDWTTLAPDVVPLPVIPGDANRDGMVTFADFVVLSNNMGKTVPAGADGWAMGDFNNDQQINFADFVTLSNNFSRQIGG